MTDRWLPAWGLAAIAFGGASLIVPLYIIELGGSAFQLGVLFATGSFVGVPGALVFGTLADKTGKRRLFVLLAMAITACAMFAIPFLERIAIVVVANALLWFGFAAAIPVLTLLAVAGEPEEQWTPLIARLNTYQGAGWAAGLGLGVLIIAVASRVVEPVTAQRIFFGACAISAATGFGVSLRTLPPDPRTPAEPSPRQLRRHLRTARTFNIRGAAFPFTPGRFDPRDLHPRRFVDRFSPALGLYFAAVLTVFTGFGVFFAPLPAFLAEAGYRTNEIFGLYLVLNVGAALFFGHAARLAERYDVIPVHAGGLSTRAIVLPLVAVVGVFVGAGAIGIGTLGALFLVIGLSWAVIAVTAATLVTTLSPAAIRGESLGVYGALVAVGGGVGGLLGGWLAGEGYLVAFGTAGGIIVIGIGAVGLLARRTGSHSAVRETVA